VLKIINWLASWWVTWRFKRGNPELYRHLCDIVDKPYNPADFVEVPTEGPYGLRIHKDALETMRQLGIGEEDFP